MSYWDTSAIVKLLTLESDSSAFRNHAASVGRRLLTAEVTRLELWTTLRRKESEALLNPGEARSLLAEFDAEVAQGSWQVCSATAAGRAEFEQVVEACLSRTPPVFIRTLDALHLAAARIAGETELVAADKPLRRAATALAFTLFPALR